MKGSSVFDLGVLKYQKVESRWTRIFGGFLGRSEEWFGMIQISYCFNFNCIFNYLFINLFEPISILSQFNPVKTGSAFCYITILLSTNEVMLLIISILPFFFQRRKRKGLDHFQKARYDWLAFVFYTINLC